MGCRESNQKLRTKKNSHYFCPFSTSALVKTAIRKAIVIVVVSLHTYIETT